MPTSPLRIAIVHQNADTRNTLRCAALQLGHTIGYEGDSAREFIERAHTTLPDLILIQDRLADGSGIAALHEVCREEPIPAILVLNNQDGPLLEPSEMDFVLAVLHEPVRSPDLIPLIPLVMRQFIQQQELRERIALLEKQMDEGT